MPATVVTENNHIVVVKDIAPKAPVHYLIIPKKHIHDLVSVSQEDMRLMGDVTMVVQDLAQTLPEPKAFRLLTNNGAAAGQSVFHLHFHFLSGKSIPAF